MMFTNEGESKRPGMTSQEDHEEPGCGDGEMTNGTEGAYLLLFLKHTILNPVTARDLERMKSKILSGIELNSPSRSKRKALRIQEPEAPRARESTNDSNTFAKMDSDSYTQLLLANQEDTPNTLIVCLLRNPLYISPPSLVPNINN
ncbi:hypothetical protein GBA52_022680 [Prunus armeniaca]|nr:hypothetical protein GBA52_022680 [Prunus armeniaca]